VFVDNGTRNARSVWTIADDEWSEFMQFREWKRQQQIAKGVWSIATQPYPEAHFATFPEELPRRCILAGTSQRGCCPECGAPWERVTDGATHYADLSEAEKAIRTRKTNMVGNGHGGAGRGPKNNLGQRIQQTTGWRPTCSHNADPVPCTVLDPFGGSGTTAAVAVGNGRNAIICELNPEYAHLARQRIGPMFVDEPCAVKGEA
jgi:hypothetical protein